MAAVAPEARPTHVPVPVGTNWYEGMDRPEPGSDGRQRVRSKRLGAVRGGHAYTFEPASQSDQPGHERDLVEWWAFYDQGVEGACEGMAHARALSLIYREKFDGFWLYDDARRLDGDYPDGEGTYNRSICAALKKWGAHRESDVVASVPDVIEREPWRRGVRGVQITEYRWLTTVEDLVATLGYSSDVTELPMLNSWGRNGYPHRVYFPLELIDRLLSEDGEASVLLQK